MWFCVSVCVLTQTPCLIWTSYSSTCVSLKNKNKKWSSFQDTFRREFHLHHRVFKASFTLYNLGKYNRSMFPVFETCLATKCTCCCCTNEWTKQLRVLVTFLQGCAVARRKDWSVYVLIGQAQVCTNLFVDWGWEGAHRLTASHKVKFFCCSCWFQTKLGNEMHFVSVVCDL